MEKYPSRGTDFFFLNAPTPKMKREAERLQFERDVQRQREKLAAKQYVKRVAEKADPSIRTRKREKELKRIGSSVRKKTKGAIGFLVRDLGYSFKGKGRKGRY